METNVSRLIDLDSSFADNNNTTEAAATIADSNSSEMFYFKNQQESNALIEDINGRINVLRKRISLVERQSVTLSKIIDNTSSQIEKLNEFTKRGQKEAILMKQLETYSVVQDILLKFEDSLHKYYKLKNDIQNRKFNDYMKLQSFLKDSKKDEDDDLKKILVNVRNLLNMTDENRNSGIGMQNGRSDSAVIASLIEKELEDY